MTTRQTFRYSFPIAMCSVVVAAIVPYAAADSRTMTDDEDFTGRLDIVRASHRHRRADAGEDRQVKHTITSARRWSRRAIRCRFDGCDAFFSIRLDVDSDRRYDRVLYLFSRRGKLRGEMFRHTPRYDCQLPRVACGRSRFLGGVAVWKPDRKSIATRFPPSLLDTRRGSYRWRAEVEVGLVERCRGDVERHLAESAGMVCTDRAPRRSYVHHRL